MNVSVFVIRGRVVCRHESDTVWDVCVRFSRPDAESMVEFLQRQYKWFCQKIGPSFGKVHRLGKRRDKREEEIYEQFSDDYWDTLRRDPIDIEYWRLTKELMDFGRELVQTLFDKKIPHVGFRIERVRYEIVEIFEDPNF